MWCQLLPDGRVELGQSPVSEEGHHGPHTREGVCVSLNQTPALKMKKAKKSNAPETNAFQQLFLLVGIHLFKVSLTFLYYCAWAQKNNTLDLHSSGENTLEIQFYLHSTDLVDWDWFQVLLFSAVHVCARHARSCAHGH